MAQDKGQHWEAVYRSKSEDDVSWYEARPQTSIDLIRLAGVRTDAKIVDVGAGASRLVDYLLEQGFTRMTLLDLSAAALQRTQQRLSSDAPIAFVVEDVRDWVPPHPFDLWHDRAAFHFLTDPEDQARYLAVMATALQPGGYAIIGTFAPDGPETCSGLPVARYDAAALAQKLGKGYALIHEALHAHRTPSGAVQRFAFGLFRKN